MTKITNADVDAWLDGEMIIVDDTEASADLKNVSALALNEALTEQLGTEVRTYDARWTRFAQDGVLVDLHLTREQFQLQLTLRDIGIEPRDKAEADQLNSIVRPGHRYLLPRNIAIQVPESIQSEARECLKRHSYKTYWGRWVHVNRFPIWLEENEALKAKYLNHVETIIANYDQLVSDAQAAWLGMCNKTYNQLAVTEAATRIPNFADRDAWLADQAQAFLARVPDRERIRARFTYQWDVFSLPSLVQQVKDESAQARWQRMSEAERAMTRALEQSARQKIQGGVDQFLSEIRGQIQAEVLSVASSALKVVQGRGGKLERNSSNALKGLIEQWRNMVFWDDDQGIEVKLSALEQVLNTESAKRDPLVTTNVLQSLAAEARLALADLDVPADRTAIGGTVTEAIEKANAAGLAWDDDLSAFTVRTAIEQADDDLFSDDDLGTVATRQAADVDDLEFEADEEEVTRQPISI
jgi:hypothetical protein